MTEERCNCGKARDDAHHCNLCHDNVTGDVHALLDHLRILHPDFYEKPERWPDGGFVTVEEPLTVHDLLDAGATVQDLLDAGVEVHMAQGIREESWLNEDRFAAFRSAYHYASGQTRAIPALAKITAEQAYFLYEALRRGHDRSTGNT